MKRMSRTVLEAVTVANAYIARGEGAWSLYGLIKRMKSSQLMQLMAEVPALTYIETGKGWIKATFIKENGANDSRYTEFPAAM